MILFPKTYNIIRKNAEGYYDNSGLYVEAPTSLLPATITADIQPLSSKELEVSNVGSESSSGKIKIFTDSILLTSIEGNEGILLQEGDMISFNGKNYRIIKEDSFQNNLISHNEYLAEMTE